MEKGKNRFLDILEHPEKYMLQAGGEYEIISELGFLRAFIKYQDYKIVLYGAGIRCEYLLQWLKKENIPVAFIIDNDPDKHGKILQICRGGGEGCMIYHCDKIPQSLRQQKYLALITTAYYERQARQILYTLFQNNIQNSIYVFEPKYGMAPYRFEWASYWRAHKEELIWIYERLGDEASREVYSEFVKTILTNQVYRKKQGKSKQKYFEGYTPLADECFLNIGSYVGDTIFYFLENRKEQFEKIYACEGERENFARLCENLQILPAALREKIITENRYIDAESAGTYDDKRITLINMDIEGAEKTVLNGLKKCIVRNRPVLAVCAYHKPEDIIELPRLIFEMAKDYKILFRKYAAPYSCHLECAELVMYGVPKERCKA